MTIEFYARPHIHVYMGKDIPYMDIHGIWECGGEPLAVKKLSPQNKVSRSFAKYDVLCVYVFW